MLFANNFAGSEKKRREKKQGRVFFFFPCLARSGEEEDPA